MGWRFNKRIPVFGKFFRINLSKKGVGWSAGIPGAGLSYGESPRASKQRPAARSGGGCLSLMAKMLVIGFLLFFGMIIYTSKNPGTASNPGTYSPSPAQPAAIAPAASAPAPMPDPAADVVGGLSLEMRREIFEALHQVGMEASREAESRYPLSDLSTDAAIAKRQLAQREAFYKAKKKQGRVRLVGLYKLDGATLDRINREGEDRKWFEVLPGKIGK